MARAKTPSEAPRIAPISGGESAPPVVVSRHSLPERTRPHGLVTHAFAALQLCTSGRARFEQQGEWILEAGDVLLVPPGAPHRLLEATESTSLGVGFCVPCFLAEGATDILEPFERVRGGASAVVRLPEPRRAFFEQLIVELEAASAPDRRHEPIGVRRSLLTLLVSEIDRAADWTSSARSSTRSVVAESLAFIERNCLRPLTLREVASAVGRSPAHVTTALTRTTGQSAVEWITAGRMAEARRLLLHSDELVDVIAERVGYTDPTHFTRMFRRAHGSTPTAWRMARRRDEPSKKRQ